MSTVRRAWPKRLIRPKSLLKTRWIPGQVHIDERAESLEVQAFARGISGDNEPDVSFLDRLLDVLSLHGGEVLATKMPLFPAPA